MPRIRFRNSARNEEIKAKKLEMAAKRNTEKSAKDQAEDEATRKREEAAAKREAAIASKEEARKAKMADMPQKKSGGAKYSKKDVLDLKVRLRSAS